MKIFNNYYKDVAIIIYFYFLPTLLLDIIAHTYICEWIHTLFPSAKWKHLLFDYLSCSCIWNLKYYILSKYFKIRKQILQSIQAQQLAFTVGLSLKWWVFSSSFTLSKILSSVISVLLPTTGLGSDPCIGKNVYFNWRNV